MNDPAQLTPPPWLVSAGDTPVPTIGRIVLYRLSPSDVTRVESDRSADGSSNPIGNPVSIGLIVPLVVVWPHPHERGWHINGQALLDGNDQLWVTSAPRGGGPGQWDWPGGS